MGIPHDLIDGPPHRVLVVHCDSQDGGMIYKSAWKAALRHPGKQLRDAGETSTPQETLLNATPPVGKTSPYPAGIPLRPDEIQRARGHLPKSLEWG